MLASSLAPREAHSCSDVCSLSLSHPKRSLLPIAFRPRDILCSLLGNDTVPRLELLATLDWFCVCRLASECIASCVCVHAHTRSHTHKHAQYEKLIQCPLIAI